MEPETDSAFNGGDGGYPIDAVIEFDSAPDPSGFKTFEPAQSRMFRDLDTEEDAAFRKSARDNYVVGQPINMVFHPVYRDECHRMNEEAFANP